MLDAYATSPFNVAALVDFLTNQPPAEVLFQLFAAGGWLVFFFLLLSAGNALWVEFKECQAVAKWRWLILAVDVPLLNTQTPKAVEQMFAHLAGALQTPNIAEKYVHGAKQMYFSLEIVSIDGYIQFLIRTEDDFRDLIEAAIYAQYPEAEIAEVEDYTDGIPTRFPDVAWDIWATDFGLAADDAYPIRTYREFEHMIVKEATLKDPMSAFLETFTRLSAGEQLWLQIIIQPAGSGWKEKAIKKIKELVGDTGGRKRPNAAMEAITDAPIKILEGIGDQLFSRQPSEKKFESKSVQQLNKIQYLTPGESKLIEAMEAKISKLGFKTKIRAVYLGRKEVFRPARAVSGLIGSINQFNVPSANSIAPTFSTKVSYWLKRSRSARRKSLLMNAYKKRKISVGGRPFYLNIEELATIWHFPMSYIKTPLLQKTTAKQGEPPPGLPIERVLPPAPPEEGERKMKFG